MRDPIHPIAERLARELEGDVRFDAMTRELFSTDASSYRIVPLGVVFPKHADDVQRIVDLTARDRIALLPRGGGTSLAGQAVGEALVIDFSKYMNRVVETHIPEHDDDAWARVQPGVVLDNFNTHLRPTGFMFGPEVSPSSQATLGGMVGNNSCGSRSIRYGKMVDHVIELQGFLASGAPFRFGQLSETELATALAGDDDTDRIIQTVNHLAVTHRDEVDRRFPKIQRRVAGYNLDELGLRNGFNLAGLLVGSEGTLAINHEARVRLVRKSAHTILGVCHFDTFAASMHASAPIVGLSPHAIELSDKLLIDLARESPLHRDKLHFVRGRPEALLIVEFAGETLEPLMRQLDDLATLMRDLGHGDNVVRITEPARCADVWAVRKAGLGLFGSVKGDAKPVAFVEDTAVAPEQLPAFTAEFRELLERHGVRAAFYGHASVGCLHIRPMLDLRTADGVTKYRAVAEEVTELALKYGGTHSGEHGEGLARSEFNPKVFGETLYAAFREVKAAFDPDGRMNPGKKVDAPPMDENLRYGADYTTAFPVPLLDYSDVGTMADAIEMCNGNARCRKSEVGTMCPSYMVTLDEMHSTRGRANALRAAISGALPAESLFSEEMHEVMDLCIGCKACKLECPSHVDMAKHKYEFQIGYHAREGVPLRTLALGNAHTVAAIGSALAPLSNLGRSGPLRWLTNAVLGLDPRRSLPRFRRDTFWRWWQRRTAPAHQDPAHTVVLLADTFTNFYEPEVPIDAVRVLEAAGRTVVVPEPTCCGRPQISKGLHTQALDAAGASLRQLTGYVERGVPILGLEPSCLLTYRDEYPMLLRTDAARSLAAGSWLVEEYLANESAAGRLALPLRPVDTPALLHGHCHQKAIATTRATRAVLDLVPGLDLTEIDSGCCGMAGSFGYEAGHFDISMAMAERVLAPRVRGASSDTIIVANGTSCRHQIADTTGRQAMHAVQVLARALDFASGSSRQP
ncbi:MAG: FAD-linked oxidase C-terminal domain-containing protein [Vicinamibacterales bacterium]|nr:hypothetical protein [Acidobacteriota bacterium]MDP7671313.1 FAD-linked oxidase C-terminal domain-containing protein [Vicinamibacterales bacterium]HJO38539.1 FAD-linked oxidase C-terminal domain-containing protein [Vicinamibacterales bacterium]